MAEETEALLIELRADITRYEAALRRQIRATEGTANAVERRFRELNRKIETDNERAMSAIERRQAEVGRNIRRVVTTAAVGLAVQEILKYGNAYVDLSNKIAAAAVVSGFQARSLDDLQESARAARSDIESYVDLYARVLRAGANVAQSEVEVARATDLVAKAFRAGGASAQEQAAGLIQIGQALGSGFLQGDELRSIRENAPLIARAVADFFNTTIGDLKRLGAEGKITSEDFFKALLQGGVDIEAAFSATVARPTDAARLAFDRLKLKIGEFVVEAGTVAAAAQTIGKAIDFIADNVELFSDAVIVAGAALTGAFGAVSLGAVAKMVVGLRGLTAQLAVTTFFAGRAAGAMGLLAASTKLIGGPVVAGIATLATILALVGVNAGEAKVSVEDLQRSVDDVNRAIDAETTNTARREELLKLLGDYEKANELLRERGFASRKALAAEIETLSKSKAGNRERIGELEKLAESNDEVYFAIRAQGVASGDVLAIEIDAVNKRIANNKRLRDNNIALLRDSIALAKAQALVLEQSLARVGQGVGFFENRNARTFQPRSIPEDQSAPAIEALREELNQKTKDGIKLNEKEIEQLQKINDLTALRNSIDEQSAVLRTFEAGGGGTTPPDPVKPRGAGGIDSKGVEEAKRLLDELAAAYDRLFLSEIEGIENVRAQRIAAVQAAKLSEQEKADAIVRINQIADEEIKRINETRVEDEQEILRQVLDARDRAVGDMIALAEREYEARREYIIKNIEDEQVRNAALLALEQERVATIAEIHRRMRDEQLRAALDNALSFEEGYRAMLDVMIEDTAYATAEIGKLFAETFGPGGEVGRALGDATADAIVFGKSFTESIGNAARAIVGNLISAMVQLGVQMVTQALIGKAAASAAVAGTVAEAGIAGAAWAPAAAMASLATLGANAGPAAAALATTTALATALAIPKGFAEGGEVRGPGTATSDSIPANLSDGEFVVRASEARKHKPLLEAINDGIAFETFMSRAAQEPPKPGPARFASGGFVGAGYASAPTENTFSTKQVFSNHNSAVSQNTSSTEQVFSSPRSAVSQNTFQTEQVLSPVQRAEADPIAFASAPFVPEPRPLSPVERLLSSPDAPSPFRNAPEPVTPQSAPRVSVSINETTEERSPETLLAQLALRQIVEAEASEPQAPTLQENPPAPAAYARGGHVRGPGTATSDSIPARLSNGEFVVNAKATRRNLPFLEALNAGQIEKAQAFATGGLVGSPSIRIPEMPAVRVATSAPTINVAPATSPNVSLQNINVFDLAEAMNRALQTPEGTRALINVVGDNPAAFNGALGRAP